MKRAETGQLPRWSKGLLAVFGAVLLALPVIVDNPYFTSIAISSLMFGLLAASFDLMIGYAGLSNFGIAGILAVGAYGAGLASAVHGLNPWIALLVGPLAAAIFGAALGALLLRVKGLHLSMMSLFVAEAIRLTISNVPGYTRGVLGLAVPPFPDLGSISFDRGINPLAYYAVIAVIGVVVMFVLWVTVRSRLGLAFVAIREDELAAESLGLPTRYYKMINITIASACIGLVGAFYAIYVGVLTPTPDEFGIARTVEILVITYVGGRRSLWGALFAGFFLISFQEYFRDLGAWRLVMFGMLLMLVMFYAPSGLAGAYRSLARRISDRLAPTTRRISVES